MIESILTSLFVASRVSIALASFGLIVGSAVYDWRAIKWQKYRKRHSKTQSLRQRPLVSVVVWVNNSIPFQSIESAAKSAYRNLEVIIISENDGRKSPISFPSRTIKQMHLPRNRNEKKTWSARLRRAIRGEIVLVINSSAQLYPRTVHELVAYFALNQRVETASLGTDVKRQQTVMSLVNEYEQAMQTSINKTMDAANHNVSVASSIAWRRRAFLKAIAKPTSKLKASSANKLGYVNSARVLVTPHTSIFNGQHLAGEQIFRTMTHRPLNQKFKWNDLLKSWYRVLLLLEPIALGYSVYVFLAYDASILLVASWLITAVSFGFFVWGDEQLKVTRRLRLTMQLPILLSLIYLMIFAEIRNHFVKTLQNFTKLRLPKLIQLSWLKH